jgi:predicted acetyltransferase
MIDLFTEYNRFGIFGASESGKTTLAKRVSQEVFTREKRPSICLFHLERAPASWGAHAKGFYNREEFLTAVRSQTTGCLVVVEDASVTVAADKDVTDLFTCIRHQNHKLLVIGHHAANLTPEMRDSLQRVFLFLQNDDAIRNYWSKIFPGHDLTEATRLQQYEVLTVANYKPLLKFRLSK